MVRAVVKDFTVEAVPVITFKINGDTFKAVGDAPGGSIIDLASVVSEEDPIQKLQAIMEFFDMALMPESAELFADRLRDPSRPITFLQAVSVFEYLVEAYTDNVRPTKAQPSSAGGSGPTSQTSTGRRRSAAHKTTAKKVSRAS